MVVWQRCLRSVLRQVGTSIEHNPSDKAIPYSTFARFFHLQGQLTNPYRVCHITSRRTPESFYLYFQHKGFVSSKNLLQDAENMEPISSPLIPVLGDGGQADKKVLGSKTSTVQAIKKGIRQSPKKVNLVAKLVRGMRVEDALLQLQVLVKRAATTVFQVIHSARANASHNHGLDPDKLIVVFRGYGGFGALGHSVYHRELLPRFVVGTWMGKITQLATSGAHTAAITDSGELYTWGRDQGDGRLGLGSGGGPGEGGSFATPSRVSALPVPVAAVSCGGFFTMALTRGGQLWSWGANSNYELGRGDSANDWKPKPIPSLQDTRIVQIASGGYHTLALTDKGEVLSWGHGGNGQLGHSSIQVQKVPTAIEALSREHITYIACGGSSSAAVTDEGVLYMWGNARDCQLGVPGLPEVQPLPVQVKFLADDERLGSHQVLSVSVGASHTMCLVLRQPVDDLLS